MGRADGMDMNARSLARQPAGCPGVIQVDVSEQDIADILHLKSVLVQRRL
jgi:hypothetical protein